MNSHFALKIYCLYHHVQYLLLSSKNELMLQNNVNILNNSKLHAQKWLRLQVLCCVFYHNQKLKMNNRYFKVTVLISSSMNNNNRYNPHKQNTP